MNNRYDRFLQEESEKWFEEYDSETTDGYLTQEDICKTIKPVLDKNKRPDWRKVSEEIEEMYKKF